MRSTDGTGPGDDDPHWKLRPAPATPGDELCPCADAPPILLQPHLSPNPLSCARCNGEVPPERIGFGADLAEALAFWRDFHDCFYRLWLDSGEFEAWAADQLRDPESPVNSRGLALAARVGAFRRCYLWWFQGEREPGDAAPTRCPRCAENVRPLYAGGRPNGGSLHVCDRCGIAIWA